MDLRTRLIAPSFHSWENGRKGDFNLDAFIKRLLLFETYIIDSQGLTEIPYLVHTFTLDGLFLLLESGALKFNCSFSHTGTLSTSSYIGKGNANEIHFPFQYKLVTMEPAGIIEYVNLLLQDLERVIDLTARQTIRFRRAIYSSLEYPGGDTESQSLKSTRQEIKSSVQLLKSAVVIVIKKRLGIRVGIDDIDVDVRFDSENDVSVDSNIQKWFNLDQLTVYKIIESALHAIAKRNDRIEQMMRYSAISGFSDIDLPIFGEKLGFLASALSSDMQEDRFQRIIELAGLPQIKDSPTYIDAKQLLKIRNSVECTEFREWLATTDGKSNDEIISQIRSLSKTIGRLLGGDAGETIRFLITNGIGFVPVIGPIVSMPLSALDHFLLERIFPRSGISAFVNDMYPSIFENN